MVNSSNKLLLGNVSDTDAAIIGLFFINSLFFALVIGTFRLLYLKLDFIKHLSSRIIITVHDKVQLWAVLGCLLVTYLVILIIYHSHDTKEKETRGRLQLTLQILVFVFFLITLYKLGVSN